MALINNNYVLAETESVTYDSESTSHPVETGISITDHIKRQPITISISGYITDTENKKSTEIIENIKKLQSEGSLINYVGRVSIGNMQIQSFSCDYSNKTWGGCQFSIELKEIRVVSSAYDEAKSKALNQSSQQVSQGDGNAVYHIVKKGECCWYYATKPYKNLKPTFPTVMKKCEWMMQQNPTAFSRKGDFRTLQIGRKFLVGYK